MDPSLHILASGSSGNALVLSREGSHILVDAGISCRRITASLRTLGLEPGDLSAVFITHTHTDHIAGVQTLLKRCPAPFYTSRAAGQALAARIGSVSAHLNVLEPGQRISIGAWTAAAFPTSHDAPGSCGFRFDEIGILTDTGYVTEEARQTLLGCRLLVLEANHDPQMLRSGPYPYALQQRILGPQGHLSNEAAGAFAVEAARAGAEEIVLAHLSQENNTPWIALETVERVLEEAGLQLRLSVAPRDTLSCRYSLYEEEVLCKR